MKLNLKNLSFSFSVPTTLVEKAQNFIDKRANVALFFFMTMISIVAFLYYLSNGLGVAYNDARSHLDISRRVVENLTPGFAQLGSVWLPLPHLLATITIWNDFMWHSGLSGALQSMASYIATGMLIYNILRIYGVKLLGRIVGVLVFALNTNILYMQSTAMTELLLIGVMTAGVYELIMWHKENTMMRLVKSGFWIMLGTLIRYDGWFLLAFAFALICYRTYKKYGYKTTEGTLVLFTTLAGFGIFLWLFWNLMIFKDPLYFAFGPYSAAAQQSQLEAAGVLSTKHNILLSSKTYIYAMIYNSGLFTLLLGFAGMLFFWFDKNVRSSQRIASIVLLAPFVFNIFALYFGHSVLFVQGLQGNSWFNVRYGLMMVPSLAIFIGYLVGRLQSIKYVLIGLLCFVTIFTFANKDAVTIDDAVIGASGKNVSQVSSWLGQHVGNNEGFVLISVASHDAIIFSSGLDMKRFIHEGTGAYWTDATTHPEKWARWIVMRTNDANDNTWKQIGKNPAFLNDYTRVKSFPFADIYELKPQYVNALHTQATLE